MEDVWVNTMNEDRGKKISLFFHWKMSSEFKRIEPEILLSTMQVHYLDEGSVRDNGNRTLTLNQAAQLYILKDR